MENWSETKMKLDQVLELERALARRQWQERWEQQWQERWQRFLRQGKRLQTFLAQAWLRRNQSFAKTLVPR